MTEKRFAMRAVAGISGFVLATSLAAAPAFADPEDRGDRSRSEQARDDAPGQQRQDEAGNPSPGNGQGNPPEHAGGPAAQSPPPGRAKPQGRPAKSPKPSKPARPAKPARPVRQAKPARPGHAPTAKPAKPVNPHAKAGKTTICHATGSATNPFVTITISDNALPAHARHQDGRDLIPAPSSGCPTAASAEAGAGAIDRTPAAAGKTGKPAAPSAGELLGFVGASAEEAPAGAVLGEVVEGGAAPTSLPPLRETIGETAEVSRRESGAPAARTAAAGQLPFTGLEAAVVALFGAMLVLLGVLFRKISRRASTA